MFFHFLLFWVVVYTENPLFSLSNDEAHVVGNGIWERAAQN